MEKRLKRPMNQNHSKQTYRIQLSLTPENNTKEMPADNNTWLDNDAHDLSDILNSQSDPIISDVINSVSSNQNTMVHKVSHLDLSAQEDGIYLDSDSTPTKLSTGDCIELSNDLKLYVTIIAISPPTQLESSNELPQLTRSDSINPWPIETNNQDPLDFLQAPNTRHFDNSNILPNHQSYHHSSLPLQQQFTHENNILTQLGINEDASQFSSTSYTPSLANSSSLSLSPADTLDEFLLDSMPFNEQQRMDNENSEQPKTIRDKLRSIKEIITN